jgi:hypothetical protein
VPRQFFPIQKHHEVGQVGLVVAVTANLAHQVHAHGITAECKKNAVAQRQNAGVTPDQIHGQRANGVTHDLANQGYGVVTEMQWVAFGHHEVEHGREHDDGRECGQDTEPGFGAEQ